MVGLQQTEGHGRRPVGLRIFAGCENFTTCKNFVGREVAKISHPAKILQAMKENFHAENYSPAHCDTFKTKD